MGAPSGVSITLLAADNFIYQTIFLDNDYATLVLLLGRSGGKQTALLRSSWQLLLLLPNKKTGVVIAQVFPALNLGRSFRPTI